MANRGALVSLAAALILWSVTFPVVRAMMGQVPIEFLLTMRFGLAAVLLFAWWAIKGGALPRGRDFWLAALSGFCCVTAYQLLSTYGIKTVASGPASVLVDTMPIFATLFSVFILKHRPKWRTWAGMSVAFAGAMVIALGESNGQLRINLGAGLLLLAALLFSLGTIAQKPIMKRYDSLGVTAVSFSAGALGMIPFSPDFLQTAQVIPLRQLAMISFLAVGPGAIAYALWAHALSKLSISKASASLFLIAPLTYFVAWIFFGEIPGLLSLFGASLALAGVFLVHSDQHA